MGGDHGIGLRRGRMDVVRRMQAAVLARDRVLDGICAGLCDAMGADAVVAAPLQARDQVFVGKKGCGRRRGRCRCSTHF